MVLAKAIRAFCEKNVGSILDVQQVARDYFPMASYKTFLRTLNRLRDEGLIVPVSKGMYLICGNEQVELDIDDVVIRDYVSGARGMIVGYEMYRRMGVSDYVEERVEIYSRMIECGNRTIGKYRISGYRLIFNDETKRFIELMELLENAGKIIDRDIFAFTKSIEERLSSFSLDVFINVLSKIQYGYPTVAALSRYLKRANIDDENCLEYYIRIQKDRNTK